MTTALAIYENFAQTKDIANALAASDLVPPHFQRKPANILIALEFAQRNDIPPFQAMQSLYVVHGRVGMSAAMAISLARKANVWKRLTYKVTGEGERLEVTAVATLHEGGEASAKVTFAQAKIAGWTKNAVYNSIPEQMLKYRAVTFLIRSHFPEVLYGLSTKDELDDIEAANSAQQVTPVARVIELPKNEPEEPKDDPATQEPAASSIQVDQSLIGDYKAELTNFLNSKDASWYEVLGKHKDTLLAAVDAAKTIETVITLQNKAIEYDKQASEILAKSVNDVMQDHRETVAEALA